MRNLCVFGFYQSKRNPRHTPYKWLFSNRVLVMVTALIVVCLIVLRHLLKRIRIQYSTHVLVAFGVFWETKIPEYLRGMFGTVLLFTLLLVQFHQKRYRKNFLYGLVPILVSTNLIRLGHRTRGVY